jgi:HEAT repeat protein
VQPADVPYLVEALQSDDSVTRLEAVKTLRLIGLETLVNTNLTAEVVADWGRATEPAANILVGMLTDQDAMIRANAAITLGFLRALPNVAVPALVEALSDPEGRVSRSAAKALGRFGGEAQSAIPSLTRVAFLADEGLREAAISALKRDSRGRRRGETLRGNLKLEGGLRSS